MIDHNLVMRFRVRKLSDLQEKIIPFFDQNPLKTKKHVEFIRFKELCALLHQKTHLTPEGFARCLKLAKNLPVNKSGEFYFSE